MNGIKKMWINNSVLISVFLLITFIISAVMLFQEHKHGQRAYEHFLNRFYFNLDSTITQIDVFLQEQTTNEERLLHQISLDLLETHKTLKDADLFLDKEIRYYDDYFITYGIYEIDTILEDSTVSPEEKDYLMNLKDTLASIKENMYSEQTGQENPNLSIDDFNKIIETLN